MSKAISGNNKKTLPDLQQVFEVISLAGFEALRDISSPK